MTDGMTRRDFVGLAGGVAATAAAGYFLGGCGSQGAGKPGNIVFIVSDAFRADRLGAMRAGESITPNLDALAAGSLVYEECYAPSSWTKTSMASILTGTYPPYHGVLLRDDTIPRNCDNMGELLRRNGYSTHCIQTNPWLAPEAPTIDTVGKPVRTYGFHRGFDKYRFLQPGKFQSAVDQSAFASAESVNAELEYLLPRMTRPFFLYLHYMETHQPWMGVEPREFTGAYCSDRGGRSRPAIFNDDQKLIKRMFLPERGEVGEDENRRLHEIYDEAVRYVDEMIFKALAMIEKAVGLDETLVIFTADHGDELLEHGRVGHAHNLYEEVVRVPFFIKGPGVRPGRVKGQVSNVNIYETVKALACPGDQVREDMGIQLLGAPKGASRLADEVIFAQLQSTIPALDWKLTKVIRKDHEAGIVRENYAGDLQGVERFDLKDDPGEERELGGDSEGVFVAEARRLTKGFEAFAQKHDVRHTKTSAKWQLQFGSKEEEEAALSEITEEERSRREQLKALGYF